MPYNTIAFWGPKGGIGKSTRCLEVAFELSQQGKSVVIIEWDTQKDITKRLFRRADVRERHNVQLLPGPELPMGDDDGDDEGDDGLYLALPDFVAYYAATTPQRPNNLYHAVLPVITQANGYPNPPSLVTVVEASEGAGAVYLLPGHSDVEDFMSQVAVAYESDMLSRQTLMTFHRMCRKIDERYDIDYILVDLDASRGRGNGHIICCCDGLIMPCEADGPSFEAVKDGVEWLMRFKTKYEARRARGGTELPEAPVKLLGTMQSKYVVQTPKNVPNGQPYIVAGHAYWMRKIDALLAEKSATLRAAGLLYQEEERYQQAGINLDTMCISRTPNFATLNTFADKAGKPVAFLDQADLVNRRGNPLQGTYLEGPWDRVQGFRNRVTDAVKRIRKVMEPEASLGDIPMLPRVPDHRTALTPLQQRRRQAQQQQQQ